jgi:membrane associated rhomboid family serine protease
MFNAPRVVVALLGVLVAIHLGRSLLPQEQDAWLTEVLAFIPARLSPQDGPFEGGEVAAVTQFFSYVLLHHDLTHLLVNSAWLLAFGSPVARRTGTARFLALFFLCGVGGALFFLAFDTSSASSMVGASGAISGLMGAAFRFLFGPVREADADGIAGRTRPPLLSLQATLADRRILLAAAGWTVLNVLLAWGASGMMGGLNIAWEAHLGGFYTGLLTYGLFDGKAAVHHDLADPE